jgi:hypothetical protein
MPPTALVSRLRAVLRPAFGPSRVESRPAELDACACCRLPRAEHGVQLIHRFVPAGRPVATW